MPSGTVTASTRASSSVGATDESTIYEYDLDSAKLVTGRNVLAVELHQVAPDSSDLSFALQVRALLRPSRVAPSLSVKASEGVLRISWPLTAGDYGLVSASAPTGPWEPVSESVLSTSGEQTVVVLPDGDVRWFRLEKHP